MRLSVPVSAFCVLAFSLARAGWVDLSANISWPNDSMDLSSVYFIGNEGWITASYTGDSGFVYHTTDGGQTFEVQLTQYPAYSVHMVSRLDGYACGWNGRVYRTTDAGANWNTLGTIATTATCTDFPPDCDTGYCCGDNGNIGRVTPEGVTRMTSDVVSHMACQLSGLAITRLDVRTEHHPALPARHVGWALQLPVGRLQLHLFRGQRHRLGM